MVATPDENTPEQETPRRPPGAQPIARGRPDGAENRVPTDKVRDESRVPTAPIQKKPGSKAPSKPGRATQLLSLEPPRRKGGAGLARDVRMDSVGGPRTLAQRNQTLMGNIGREKTGRIIRPHPSAGQLATDLGKPSLKRMEPGKSVDLGTAGKSDEASLMRRKATRVVPKPGGGFQGESPTLGNMDSGPLAPVMQPARREARPPRTNVPPRVHIPIPPSPGMALRRPSAPPPPPPSARGNTLAGISAEDLLGDEGRQMLADMRQREADAVARDGAPFRYGGKIQPDALGYGQTSDQLAPQDFLQGRPSKVMTREEIEERQNAPADPSQPPPPDDLGYERPVDFGDPNASAAAPAPDGSVDPVARESVAHDEMEQRAGYLMWLQGVVTLEEMEEAMKGVSDVSDAVRDLLMNTGFTEQITLYRFLARHESLAPVDFELVKPSKEALACLRPAIARAYRVIPFAKLGELLFVAAAFPFDPRRLLELRRLTASKVKLYVATEAEIETALESFYGDSAKPTGNVTGEGDQLARRYDPTLTGEDSGLYLPQSAIPEGDAGVAELDYAGGGVGSDSSRADRTSSGGSGRKGNPRDTLDGSDVSGGRRTDSGNDAIKPAAGDELDLGAAKRMRGPDTDPYQSKADDSGIDSGPEVHDPFQE